MNSEKVRERGSERVSSGQSNQIKDIQRLGCWCTDERNNILEPHISTGVAASPGPGRVILFNQTIVVVNALLAIYSHRRAVLTNRTR